MEKPALLAHVLVTVAWRISGGSAGAALAGCGHCVPTKKAHNISARQTVFLFGTPRPAPSVVFFSKRSFVLIMKLFTSSFVIILQAAAKATAEANLRGVPDLNIDIIPVDMRELEGNSTNATATITTELEGDSTSATATFTTELEGNSTNATATFTTDGELICHPYDLDWDDLTNNQQTAARDLSFDSDVWDDDTAKDPKEIRNDYWIDAPDDETELTNKERTAAIVLGWNEGKRRLVVYRLLLTFFCFG